MMEIDKLIDEYLSCAERVSNVEYSDKDSVRLFNALSDQMRGIVDIVVSLGHDALLKFTCVLDKEPASIWAAHHLVEKADLDSSITAKCFARVERAKAEADEQLQFADAMGEEMWLKEWRARKTQ